MKEEKKIFVSHAAADQPLVDRLIKMLSAGISIDESLFFCTSRKGDVELGEEFKASILEQLQTCPVALAVITPNFYNSAFCMCELGAIWSQAKKFIPILVPPLDTGDLQGILSGLQVVTLRDGLEQIADALRNRLELDNSLDLMKWSNARGNFLDDLEHLLGQLPDTTRMDVSRLKTLIKAEADQVAQESDTQMVFTFTKIPIILWVDVAHDRMRLFSPFMESSKLTSENKDYILKAHFTTTMDARYAVQGDNICSLFLHPLSTLRDKDVRSAIRQVASLALTFGSEYSSGPIRLTE